MVDAIEDAQHLLLCLLSSLAAGATAFTKGKYDAGVREAICNALQYVFLISATFQFSITELVDSKMNGCANERIHKKRKTMTSRRNHTTERMETDFLRKYPEFLQRANKFQPNQKEECWFLSLSIQVGQTAEILQWMEVDSLIDDLSDEVFNKVAAHIGDITIYLLRICKELHLPSTNISNTPDAFQYFHISDIKYIVIA